MRCKETEAKFRAQSGTGVRISEAEVGTAIDELNSGKSLDEYGLASEHFKAAKPAIVPIVTRLFNSIISERKVPESFKTGIITPVLKKGKDSKSMENYRGITVSATFGKLFEYSVLNKMKIEQSEHQFGFTKGLSPNMAALLISEAKAEARQNNDQLYLATLDAQKAFDVVHHTILLDRLAESGIPHDIWLIIKDLYSDISSKVKWLGDCSDRFPVNQGVRQGGILSTPLYKVYVHPLLDILKNRRLGFRLGTVYIGSPAVADDVAYLTRLKYELQMMFGEGSGFSARNRYQIHPTKTIVAMLSGRADDGDSWTLGENELVVSDRATHLGITRAGKKESEINILDRISLARRTSYLLMNTGLHGTNGLNPETSYVIYKCYVLPRMLYGLEVIHLTKTQLSQLERYHLRTLRQIQGLPQRTANSAVYMLLGALPIEAEIHKKQLGLLHTVVNSDNKCLRDVVQRQLACSFNNEYSFFHMVALVLEQYSLQSLSNIMVSDIGKEQWKSLCKNAVASYWTRLYRDDIKNKKTLKYLSVRGLRVGHSHLVWQDLETVSAVRKGVIKARFLTGVYLLQLNRHIFSNKTTDPNCRLCQLEVEDTRHLVTGCPAYHVIRTVTTEQLKKIIIDNSDIYIWKTHFSDWESFLRIIICPDIIRVMIPELSCVIGSLEAISRDYFYKVHTKRLFLMKQQV